jgi:hypothetical protein
MNNQQYPNPAPQAYSPYPQPYVQQPYAQYAQAYRPVDLLQMLLQEDQHVVRHHKQRVGRGLKIEPTNMTFATQNKGEKIFVYLRRHWIENLGWMIKNFFYAFIPFVIYFVLDFLEIDIRFLGVNEISVFLIAFYSVLITNIYRDFFDWFFDIYIITNERVLNYQFKPLANYSVKEGMLQGIDSIEETAGGIISDLFGYGDLIMTIEGPSDEFRFKRIPHASVVRDIIADLSKIAKKYYGRQ